MSSFKDVVVCKFAGCNQVYNNPLFLPCGKRTCAIHVDEMMLKRRIDDDGDDDSSKRKMIKCHFCEEIHSFPKNGKGFPVDENIPLLLNSMYSREHSAAKKSFSEVTQLIDKLTKIDQQSLVIDYFERVEADIVQEKEVNMQKLVAHYQQLVDKVHERMIKCLHKLTNKTLECELDAIRQTLAEHEEKLKRENFDFIIKTLDGDEDKWKAIQSECATLLDKVKSLEGELIEKIIGVQIKSSASSKQASIQDICGNLYQGTINSAILSTDEMKNNLLTLCKLSGKQFNLIYRATRDGFKAKSFHSKCDNQPKTLTIVKTTTGYIFGGYISVAWDSTSGFKSDPKAFLFNLVNALSAPHIMPAQVGDTKSVYCDASYGPVFGGGHDLFISRNSNKTSSSFFNLSNSYNFTSAVYRSNQDKPFLAGSNFTTSEIEVFILF